MADIIRGNRTNMVLTLKMDCVPITTLASALAVHFVVKEDLQCGAGDFLIDKSLADGITLDDPATGQVTVPITTSDTMYLDEGQYEMAIQITWGAGDVIEWRFHEKLNLLREVIPQV